MNPITNRSNPFPYNEDYSERISSEEIEGNELDTQVPMSHAGNGQSSGAYHGFGRSSLNSYVSCSVAQSFSMVKSIARTFNK